MKRPCFFSRGVRVLCLAALLLHGCAENQVEERFSTPRKTYELWLDKSAGADMAASMECTTRASRKFMDIKTKGRRSFNERMVQSAQGFKNYSVADENVKGTKAVIVIRDPQSGNAIAIPFLYEDNGWKVDLVAMFSGLARGAN